MPCRSVSKDPERTESLAEKWPWMAEYCKYELEPGYYPLLATYAVYVCFGARIGSLHSETSISYESERREAGGDGREEPTSTEFPYLEQRM